MFFSMGHGKRIIKAGEAEGGASATAAVAPAGLRGDSADQSFGYLFTDAQAPEFPTIAEIEAKLDALAAAMAEATPDSDELNGSLPPIFTYLGQFIDHDISVNTDKDTAGSKIGEDPLELRDRNLVEANVQNGRRGSLGLDSLYGDVPEPNPDSEALQAAMRNGAFLREGMTAPFGQRPVLPRTGGDDLPRVGPLIDAGVLDPANLPDALRPDPANPEDDRRSLAFIGDGRNDENLIVAQLHLAFIRFHNAVARRILADRPGIAEDDVFRMACKTVTWTYQWLIVNEFLPAICRRADVEATIAADAPLYTAFFQRLSQGNLAGLLPLPLEFSAAAYRYGHTMVRQNYDFNLNFGRPSFDQDGPRRATLTQFFEFTGRSVDESDPFGPAPGHRLPHNWVVEWNRFVESRPLFPDRMARSIDTLLAPDLFNMIKEAPGIFKNLALRNLRRGYNMNLPSGQAVQSAMQAAGIQLGQTINRTQLRSGATGRALRAAGLDTDTPLWFYVLKEAEQVERGARLGTVGSFLVADTIIGLLKHDRESYWQQSGSGPDGRWHPRDGISPIGTAITSINALLEAAGVLESGIGTAPTTVGVSTASANVAAAPASLSVEDDVFDKFEATFRPIDDRFWGQTPSHRRLYHGNSFGFKLDFQNGVNAPLLAKYESSGWTGMTQAELDAHFEKNFNVLYDATVKSLLDAINS